MLCHIKISLFLDIIIFCEFGSCFRTLSTVSDFLDFFFFISPAQRNKNNQGRVSFASLSSQITTLFEMFLKSPARGACPWAAVIIKKESVWLYLVLGLRQQLAVECWSQPPQWSANPPAVPCDTRGMTDGTLLHCACLGGFNCSLQASSRIVRLSLKN